MLIVANCGVYQKRRGYNLNMNENKKKYAFWMRPSMIAEIEEMLPEADVKSKSEFVCKAVETYIGLLRSKKCMDFLSPLLAGTIKGEVESLERNVSEMLFKLAVEQSVTNGVLAAAYSIDPQDVESFRKQSAQSVAETNGILDLESTCEMQSSDTIQQNWDSEYGYADSFLENYDGESGVM